MRDMLLAMDPPRHTAYRKPVAPEFKQVIAELDGRVREVVRGIFDHADQSGPDVEFVHDVCAHLPSQILGEIMGLPAEDWPAIHAMAERNSGSQDPDVSDGQERLRQHRNGDVRNAVRRRRRASGPQGISPMCCSARSSTAT